MNVETEDRCKFLSLSGLINKKNNHKYCSRAEQSRRKDNHFYPNYKMRKKPISKIRSTICRGIPLIARFACMNPFSDTKRACQILTRPPYTMIYRIIQ